MDTTFPSDLARFQLRSKLGQGGMGVVYRVHDLEMGRDVALKTLQTLDAEAIYRFKREFRSLSELSHPNLINLYELFSENDTWFFTMEIVEGMNFLAYVSGVSLSNDDATQPGSKVNLLATDAGTGTENTSQSQPKPSLTLEEQAVEATHLRAAQQVAFVPGVQAPRGFVYSRLIDAMTQLAKGVQALHDFGKEHRDLKPANVMVTNEGRVVLLDFGLALDRNASEFDKDVSEISSSSGTPSYMAPERHLGEQATVASDWYSVGVMLYEALTGTKPFMRASEVIAGDPPRPPIDLNPDTPQHLSDLALALLSRDPTRRPRGPEILSCLGQEVPRSSPSTIQPAVAQGLVGRKEHLAQLASAFGKLAQLGSVQVRVQGPSGYGKTALLRHFLEERMKRREAVVLAGRCYERESVPYKVFDSVIDSLTRYLQTLPSSEARRLMPPDVKVLTRLFPPLLRVPAVAAVPELDLDVKDVHELARRAAAALKKLLNAIAVRQPLVLYVDDLQWGDVDSSRLLAELLSPPAPLVMLIVSFRSEDLKSSGVLHQLLDATAKSAIHTETVEVGPLSEIESTELARRMIGDQSQVNSAQLTQEAAGSPFFVQQLAQYASTSHGARQPGAQLTLFEVLRANLSSLPAGSSRLLTSVAVAGRPIPRQVAAQAAELEGLATDAFNGLRAGNWVRVGGPRPTDTVETYHDKIREVLVADLAPERLQVAHRTLAALFEAQSPQDPEALTAHWLGAGEPLKANRYALLAAQNASNILAFDRAAALYRTALSTLPAGSEQRREVLSGLAEALKNAGRGQEAAEVYIQAAEVATDADDRREFERRAFEQYLISGALEKGRDLAVRVLATVGLSLPSGRFGILASLLYRRARVTLRGRRFKERTALEVSRSELARIDVCWSMAVGLSLVDSKLGSDYTSRYLMYALDGGEPDRLSRALSLEAAHQGSTANHKKADALVSEAEVLAERCKSPHAIAFVAQNRGWVEYFQGRYQKALGFYDGSARLLRERCTGVAWELSTAEMMATWSLLYLGQWGELSKRFPRLMAEARQTGNLYRIDGLGVCAGVLSGLVTDEVPRVRAEMTAAAAEWTPSGFQLQHFFRLLMRGWVDLYAGESEGYWPHLLEQWKPLTDSLLMTVTEIKYRMHSIRAFAAASLPDSKEARAQALKSAKILSRIPSTGAGGLAGVVRAALLQRDGRSEQTISELKQAIAEFERAGMALYAAGAEWRLGQVLGGDSGAAKVQAARAAIEAQGVRKPEQMLRALAPGFSR